MSEPRITAPAEEDLREIGDYLGQRSEAAAEKVLTTILDRARLHANLPLMGRLRDELSAGLRSFVVAPYVIFYRPIADTIEVLRILHGARDIESIMKEPDPE
jgi:toxin ParE1/3/4